MNRQRLNKPFRWLIIALSVAICLFSAFSLPVARLDLRFLLLALITISLAWRVRIPMPLVNGQITVSDTFIFLTMLLYGGEAAILLAAVEGACSSLGMSRKWITFLYNAAAMALPTFLTAWILRFCFGPIRDLPNGDFSSTFISAICLMALVQYVTHSSLAAIAQALKVGEPIWVTWKKYCLWASISYFGGASAAALMAKLSSVVNVHSLLATAPIITIVYWTYRTYLKNIEIMAAAAKAEAAATAKAEAAAMQAAQAQRYIEELSHHMAEQERISKELQESKEHFRHAAFHDALTGLPNRAFITDHLKRAIERAKQCQDYQFAVMFLDLDRFKNINDSLGHTVGDQLLVAIARKLEAHLRSGDLVARLGGDEFAIFLDRITSDYDAVRTAERIQETLLSPLNLCGHEVYTTASIGIALSAIGYDDSEDLLRDADSAMYRAKEDGKARYEIFDQAMHAHALSRLRLESDLRRAIEHQEFRLHYQPIVTVETGKLAGFEALVRWQHPERELVSPVEFISVAEETGLIVPLGEWVLEAACRQMREWQQRSPASRALKLSINLSGKQVAQPNLVEQITQILQRTGFDPHCLKLEITESVMMENAEAAADMFERLRALGVQLSIDDFGTGYSSLSYLHRFPVNYLKIDRSFVSRMSESGDNFEIVRTIAMLAHNLGMKVIAEGIETAEQLTQLQRLRCEYGQGYLFSQPINKETTEALILNKEPWQASIASFTELPPEEEDVELSSSMYSM